MLPCTLKLPVALNVPMPELELGVKPVCFHIILFPAITLGDAVLAANVVQVVPLSKLYCKAFCVNVNALSSNATNIK